MTLRQFNTARTRLVGGALCVLAFLGFIARTYLRVRDAQGMLPYVSASGVLVYPVAVLVVAAALLIVLALMPFLGWRRAGQRSTRRARRNR